ncbi:DUF6694 family lipoprotein [Geopseudomonas aromaticivorans]
MKAILKTAAAVALCSLLAACDSDPTLNTTNSDTLRDSRKAMMYELTDAERGQVYRALDRLEKHEVAKQLQAGKRNFDALILAEESLKKRIHGMSAEELIEEGEEAEEDRIEIIEAMRG